MTDVIEVISDGVTIDIVEQLPAGVVEVLLPGETTTIEVLSPGLPGARGVPGKSAYDTAVEEGFIGDEAAWLASLQGADGQNGVDGAQGPQGIPGTNGANGANGSDGADGASAYEVAVANGFVGDEAAWLASLVGAQGPPGEDGATGPQGAQGPPGEDGATGPQGAQGPPGEDAALPPGGTTGQALRKVSADDGDADWSPFWVVDPVTGHVTHTTTSLLLGGPPDYPHAEPFGPTPDFITVKGTSTTSDYGAFDTDLKIDRGGNFSMVATSSGYGIDPSQQRGLACFQAGASLSQLGAYYSTQLGYNNTQSASSSVQTGSNNTQAGYSANFQTGTSNTQSGVANAFQAGYANTQSGASSFQSGVLNTQAGDYGFQTGVSLNDGGFHYTAMFGNTKTATVAQRAYFALDNGIWLKPFAGDAASPENGVIGYNSALQRFRGYANGAFVDIGITVGTTPPASPVIGQLWLDTN